MRQRARAGEAPTDPAIFREEAFFREGVAGIQSRQANPGFEEEQVRISSATSRSCLTGHYCRLFSKASLYGANRNPGWKLMVLCAVVSPRRVHGDTFQDGSQILLNSRENQCSMGFQPVSIRTIERRFPVSTVLPDGPHSTEKTQT
jgi:hypothetical protein